MRGSSTPPGHSHPLWGSGRGAARGERGSPAAPPAGRIGAGGPPIRASPLASSARYSRYTLPSRTTAAGLKVAYASHATLVSFIAETNRDVRLGVMTGFASLGF